MALILSAKDLEPLFNDPASMDGLLDEVEDVLSAQQRNAITSQGGFRLPMADGKRALRVVTASLAGSGEVMRITAQFRGAKDAHLNVLFDDETGDLLAVTAADELNIWRTGAPAGIGSRYLAPPEAKRLGLLGSGRQARGQLVRGEDRSRIGSLGSG
jgi:ornithine cyclodeaminase/alanine dehydrogenase-like protein (mu-crystallin family)